VLPVPDAAKISFPEPVEATAVLLEPEPVIVTVPVPVEAGAVLLEPEPDTGGMVQVTMHWPAAPAAPEL
jgi:hypothetical protein